MYSVMTVSFSRAPLITSVNWTKFSSLSSSTSFLAKVAVILSLSAPGAVKLLNPWALSDKEGSMSADIISSLILNPILWLEVLAYWSNIKTSSSTSTKCPLKK